jgi:hypothetical protein
VADRASRGVDAFDLSVEALTGADFIIEEQEEST